MGKYSTCLLAGYTSNFAVPLFRGKWKNPALRRLAIRSALVALLGMASSATNLIIYASHNGHELSWVCLFSCTIDTVFCAAVLCVLTGRKDGDREGEPSVAPHGASQMFIASAGAGEVGTRTGVVGTMTGAGGGGASWWSRGGNPPLHSHVLREGGTRSQTQTRFADGGPNGDLNGARERMDHQRRMSRAAPHPLAFLDFDLEDDVREERLEESEGEADRALAIALARDADSEASSATSEGMGKDGRPRTPSL